MKIKYALMIVLLSLGSPALYAAEYNVNNSTEFENTWSNAVAGDTIVLNNDVDLGALPELSDKTGSISIVSAFGQNHHFVWNDGSANASLPKGMVLSNVLVVGSPLSGDLFNGAAQFITIGQGNTFTNNSGSLGLITQGAKVGANNIFSKNTDKKSQGGAVFHISSDQNITIAGGNQFTDNQSTGNGGAISLADRLSTNESYQLVLNADSADILFSGNYDNVSYSSEGTLENPGSGSDVYMGSNTRTSIVAANDLSVELGTGLISADNTAYIAKTGEGTLIINDASMYHGSMSIQEGRVVLRDNAIFGMDAATGGSISVASEAVLELADFSSVSHHIELSGGTLDISSTDGVNVFANIDSKAESKIELAEAAVLYTNTMGIAALSGKTVTLNQVLMTDTDITGANSSAKLSNASLTLFDNTSVSSTILSASSVESYGATTLDSVTLTDGTSIMGGSLSTTTDLSIEYSSMETISIAGEHATSTGSTLNSLEIIEMNGHFDVHVSEALLTELQLANVDSVTFDILSNVTLHEEVVIDFNTIVNASYNEALTISLNGVALEEGDLSLAFPIGTSDVYFTVSNIREGLIPEPSSTTLSLIALTGVLMRRRRKI